MSTTLDALASEFQNYVVAPLNAFGLGGFLFDAEGETTARLSAEITDHYTEDNRAVQDHIAIHPNRITLKGYVGEVIYALPTQDQSFLQTAVQKLTTISAFLPTISASATQAQAAIASPSTSDLTLSDASNIYGLVKNLLGAVGDEARQQTAYTYFKALMSQGVLMGVQTPWEFMTNMAIESITAIQGENSKFITDFSVTMKQIRIAKTISQAYSTTVQGQSSPNNLSPLANQEALNAYRTANGMATPPIDKELAGAAALQAPDPVQIGNVAGVSLPTTTLPGWQSQLNSVQDILSNSGALSILKEAGAQ